MSSAKTVRSAENAPYAAGLTSAEIGARTGGRIVKLNSNENPLGASPAALAAARDALVDTHRYPPGFDATLCAALARHHEVDAERVVVTAGSVELLELLLRCECASSGGEALAFAPCFPAFAVRAERCGVGLRQVPLGDGLFQDLERLAEAVTDATRLVYIANPDNPSGMAVQCRRLLDFAAALPPRALLVVDEAYVEFADEAEDVSLMARVEALGNVAVVRTFSKAYGLAGLRVGYGVLPPQTAARLRAMQLAFAVSVPAGAAAMAALGDEAHRLASIQLAREGRRYLFQVLENLGCSPLRGQGPFVTFCPPADSAAVFEALLDRGVAVRPLAYAGLPRHLRVSCGTQDENHLFAAALGEVLETLAR